MSHRAPMPKPAPESMRLDKWLWAARFYKTRALAVEEIGKGRVLVNDQTVKPAREVHAGDRITVRQGTVIRTVLLKGLSNQRGPAPVAQQLYEETEASRLAREASAEQRRLAAEPALTIEQGRPTKRDRRQLDQARWGDRWSASADS
jgi:ribosome-associated heat shock protein Hsp15